MSAGTAARNQAPGGDTREQNQAPQQQAPLVPFIRASDEHVQPANIDENQQLDASSHNLGTHNIPAYGHLAWLYVKVTATSGAAGLNNAVLDEDAPFNVLRDLDLKEPNGAQIVHFVDGYQMYLANKWGGYLPAVAAEPKNSHFFTEGGNDGNFQFILRVPVQINGRDALGSLANQDSAGQFQFTGTVAAASDVFTTEPDTLPSIRVQAWMVAWDQPEPQTAGMSNSIAPPASGTTAFWSVVSGKTVNSGDNTIELTRKGNYIRVIIFVLRDGGSRADGDADWPSETRFLRDAFAARYYDDDIWQQMMFDRTGFNGTKDAAGALDNGVRVHDYMHEFNGTLGFENRDMWQPTRPSTRLEITGSFGAAGTLDIITNDVAIADNVFLG